MILRSTVFHWLLLTAGCWLSSGFLSLRLEAVAQQPDEEPVYDLVLRGGKLVDGTGAPWRAGDLAIRGDRIVAVGRLKPPRPNANWT